MKNKTKIFLIIFLVIVILILGAYLGINLYMDSLLDKTNKGEVIKKEDASINEVVEVKKEAHDVFNFALFGLDYDEKLTDSGKRSDAIKIVSLDYTDKKIYITSIERDVVAFFPGDYNYYGHYNWAYWYGGATLAIKTLNYNLDLDIVNYVSLNLEALIEIVDELGGVDINLSSAEANYLGLNAGLNHFDGYTTMRYVRIRYIDSDYSRMERQNNVIRAIISKFSDLDFTSIFNTINVLLSYVETNFTNAEIKSYLYDVLSFDLANFETYKMPMGGYDDTINCPVIGGYLLKSYTDQVEKLHKNIYKIDDYTCSLTVIENEKRTYEKYGIQAE